MTRRLWQNSAKNWDFQRCSKFSERICKACGRNLRSTHSFYNQIKSALQKESDKENGDVAAQVSGDLQAKEFWYKRGLPTTVSPERRSPQRKKVEGAEVPARKSLGFRGTSQSVLNRTLSELSINELVGQPSTQIKVLVLNPNPRTETKSNLSEESKSLIMNIVRNKWQTVADTVFRHPEVKTKLLEPLRHAVDAEFKEYCKDTSKSILLAKSPKEIAEFTNEKFLEEVHLACPYWEAAVKGASGVENLSSSKSGSKINSLALSSAAVARARNQKMSALAQRLSTILFHSGTKSVDIARMSKLGVSMSAESTVEFQG